MLWIEMKAEIAGQPVASASKMSAASKRVSAGAADILSDIDSAEAQRRCLADDVNGKVLFLVPFQRMRRDLLAREVERHVANGDVILVEREIPT